MKIIDLSHCINEQMPVFPNTAAPQLTPILTVAQHGFGETMLRMMSHTGTHIDAPAHMIAGAAGLDDFPVDKFFGLALIIDYPPCAGSIIEFKALQQMEEKIGRAEFVLFHTGHDKKWGQREYFGAYATLSAKAAEYLASFPLKGIGIDAISFDGIEVQHSPIHHILLGANFILIENLSHLEQVEGEYCLLSVLPLKYGQADGSPVRAVAIEMEVGI